MPLPRLIHAMVRVRDLDRSLLFYEQALGLREVHRLEFPDFTLVYLRNSASEFELELTWNRGHEQPYVLGDGYGHLAVSVADLAAARTEMETAAIAVAPIRELVRDGTTLARFFFIVDPDGYRIEVLERAGHYQ
jgi:lactoylglutathione lyase